MTASIRIHGGPDALGVPLHDFSTNSNARGPSPVAMAAVKAANPSHYPDASYMHLKRLLARFHEVDDCRVVLAASASEFIFRITAFCARRCGTTVSLPLHAYGDYAQAAAAHGMTVSFAPNNASLIWACEPSSPLGMAHVGLADLIDRESARLIVLDRAYEPLRLGGAPTLNKPQLDAVWQLWTPNKALGLTGIRAAYAIAPDGTDDQINAVNALCPSWPIGSHGVAMLQSWVGDEVQRWLDESRTILRQWKVRQIRRCESLGWECIASQANFFCARPTLPAGFDLPAALATLRQDGIKLRDTASFGLPGHVRISVQAPDAQDALADAWRKLKE